LKHNTWRSVAGTIDELKEVADRLGEDGTQASRRLRDRIMLAIPRFEASEEVYRPQHNSIASLRSQTNSMRRNGNAETTVMLVNPSLPVQNQGFPFTKAAPVGSGSDILIPMKRMGPLMLRRQDAHTGSQA